MTANSQPLVIRQARIADSAALARLAQLDGAPPLLGDPLLIAEIEGLPVAALSLESGKAIADPFHPSAALVEVLRLRAAQIRGERPSRLPGLRSWVARIRRPAPAPRPAETHPAAAHATPGNATLMISRNRG